ncbi:hypothetical protein MLD38_013734 [Melastoma candidum]|uniref:Uncharacterized protein n=1 Tax=Melastoma candidum TaxID=119954 RepID=A0ACB9RB43_9MYRT|nr:hypothetical protein MLD38_013734 [Melastoma candidum]
MASSEIQSTGLSAAPQKTATQNENTVIDVFSACAYGDLDKLRKFVQEDGASVCVPDANGYYPLQWACLNNFPEVARYIIQHGGNVNATDNMKQTALHWAAVHGAVACADLLIDFDAPVDAADINGYRAVHVAAQYGQTAFLNHLVAVHNAEYDVPDNDGRTPLHWAAYKGYPDTIRLLLFRDASQERQDKDGCTPLHWAALRGNTEACTVLVHAGTKKELTIKDNKGVTPVDLAFDKGHRPVAIFLSNAQLATSDRWIDKIRAGIMGDVGFAPVLFCVVVLSIILFINSVVAAPNLPKVTATVGLWSWVAVSVAVGALVMFYRCSSKDPGFLKATSKSSSQGDTEDPLLNLDVDKSSVWTGNWSQLCPTCKIIRPIRSKHCPKCKHCVEQFDHHCPWISNCVGKKNKWDFFIFVCMGLLTSFLGGVLAIQRLFGALVLLRAGQSWFSYIFTEHPGIAVFLFLDGMIFIAALTLATAQASQIARNITTNELANHIRYGYLRGPDGRFRNPYNHGCQKNCSDFLIQGYTNDEEIAWPSLQQVR